MEISEVAQVWLHAVFISNTFMSYTRLKLAKNWPKTKHHPTNCVYFNENRVYCVYFNEYRKMTWYLIISKYFMPFCSNIRNYPAEVSDNQWGKMDLNIILSRVNNFDIKQKMAWNVCLTIYPQHQTKSKWVNTNKA